MPFLSVSGGRVDQCSMGFYELVIQRLFNRHASVYICNQHIGLLEVFFGLLTPEELVGKWETAFDVIDKLFQVKLGVGPTSPTSAEFFFCCLVGEIQTDRYREFFVIHR